MLRSALLTAHVTAGSAGLVLGPCMLAMHLTAARSTPPTWLHGAYQAAVIGVSLTTVGLAASAPGRLWWLVVLAIATQTAGLRAAWLRRQDDRLPRRVLLLGGSYLSLVTAALVVSWDSPLAWVLPTLLLAPPLHLAVHRLAGRHAGHVVGLAASVAEAA